MSEGDSEGFPDRGNPDVRAWFPRGKHLPIPHYYGDHVRKLLFGTAIVSVIAIPLWGDLLPFGMSIQIALAILLVLLAGLTNPQSQGIMLANVIVSAFGILFLEATSIAYYSTQSFALFLARESCVIMLLFAFYFSIKTLRSMMLGFLREDPQK